MEEIIESRNKVIVLASAGFSTFSGWCVDEPVDDPLFKLFIILIEPVRNLLGLKQNYLLIKT